MMEQDKKVKELLFDALNQDQLDRLRKYAKIDLEKCQDRIKIEINLVFGMVGVAKKERAGTP